MTNTVIMLTLLSTNWLPITLQAPIGDGSNHELKKEIGIIVSNRYAQVVADNKTNRILISSQAVPPKAFLIRDYQQTILIQTNQILFFTNAQWRFK